MSTQEQANPFDHLSERYDGWFDTDDGRAIFAREVACLRELLPPQRERWLEVGVGTGRFAEALGIPLGIDPSEAVLRFARDRGVQTRKGAAEQLPYADGSLDGAVLVVTLCFLEDPRAALRECARVLRDDGRIILGLVPSDSPWGRKYRAEGSAGHPFYSVATFYSSADIARLTAEAGFVFERAMSCLLSSPGEPFRQAEPVPGVVDGAGFVAFSYRKDAGGQGALRTSG